MDRRMENATDLSALIDRLARMDPGQFPFVSLYLNTQPDDRGRDHYQAFTRSELGERAEPRIAVGRGERQMCGRRLA